VEEDFFFEGQALPCGSQVCCRERAVGVMAPTFVAASECAMNTRCVFVLRVSGLDAYCKLTA
jgi:hypothetical protein